MTVKEAMKTVEGYLPDCDTRKFVLDILERAEKKKGEWKTGSDEYGTFFVCTVCGYENSNYEADEGYTDFCPGCGADMRT